MRAVPARMIARAAVDSADVALALASLGACYALVHHRSATRTRGRPGRSTVRSGGPEPLAFPLSRRSRLGGD